MGSFNQARKGKKIEVQVWRGIVEKVLVDGKSVEFEVKEID